MNTLIKFFKKVTPVIVAGMVLLAAIDSQAQRSVGIGTTDPNDNAVLELSATDQGFLVPRLTTSQRTGIQGLGTNDTGLMVYDTNEQNFYFWNGSNWIEVIGDYDESVTKDKLNPDVAGNGLRKDTDSSLAVNTGYGIEIINDTLRLTQTGVVGGIYGDSIFVPKIQVDNQGRVVSITNELIRLQDGIVNTNKIQDSTILAEDIATGAIISSKLDTGSVESFALLDRTIVAVDIAEKTITNLEIRDSTIQNRNIQDSTITNQKFTSGSVDSRVIQNESLTTNDILNETILEEDIADESVTSAKIADGTIEPEDILNQSITGQQIAPGSVGVTRLDGEGLTSRVLTIGEGGVIGWEIRSNFATNSLPFGSIFIGNSAGLASPLPVSTPGNILIGNGNGLSSVPMSGEASLSSGGVFSINENAVTSEKILDATITSSDLGVNSVTTAAIQDQNVTNSKIQDLAVSSSKLGVDAVTTTKILDRAVSLNKITTGTSNAFLTTTSGGEPQYETKSSLFSTAAGAGLQSSADALNVVVDNSTLEIQGDVVQVRNSGITSAKILDLTIQDDDIADAAITNVKLDKPNIPISGFGSAQANVDLGNQRIINLGDPVDPQDGATKSYVDSEISNVPVANGITNNNGTIELGGTLNRATNIILSGNNFTFTGTNGNLVLAATGNTILTGTATLTTGTGQVTFGGNVDANNGLDVSGADLTVGGTSFTVNPSTGDIMTQGGIDVTGTGSIGSDLTVAGNTDLNSNVNIGGKTTLSNAGIAVGAGQTITEFSTDGSLADNSNSALPTERAVKTYVDSQVGSISADNGITENPAGNFQLGGTLSQNTIIDVQANTFTIQGTSGILSVTSNASLTGTSTAISTANVGTLNVSGVSSLNGNTTLGDNATDLVTVNAGMDANNGLDVTGANLTVGGNNFFVEPGSGNTTIAGTLNSSNINNAAAISSATLTTSGLATLSSASVTGNQTVGGTISVTGTTNTNGISNTGNITSGTLTSTGNTSVGGTLQLPNGNAVNEFSIDGSLAGDSDLAVPTEKAVRTFVETTISNNDELGELQDVTLAGEAAGDILIYNGTNDDYRNQALTGDANVDENGLLTITNDAVGTDEIANNTVRSEDILDGTIAAIDLATNSVDSDEIVDGAVRTEEILDGTIATIDVADGAINSAKILNNSIDSVDINTGAIKSAEIATGAVRSDEILDGTIATIDIANDAVNATKINADIAGDGLVQNGTSGAIEINPGNGVAIVSDAVTVDINGIAGEGLIENAGNVDLDISDLSSNITPVQDTDILAIDDGTTTGFISRSDFIESAPITNINIDGGNIAAATVIDKDPVVNFNSGDVRGSLTLNDLGSGTGALTIQNQSVTTAKLADDGVTAAKLNADVAGAGLIQDAGTGAINIGAGTGITVDVDEISVDISGIAGNGLADDGTDGTLDVQVDGTTIAITGNQLLVPTGGIGNAQIDASAITSNKIFNGTINVDDIGTNAVGTDEIADGAVGNSELAGNAVTTDKIDAGAVGNTDLDKTNIPLSGFGAATADVPLGGNAITGIADPINPQDAATKNYVDTEVAAITTLPDGAIYIGDGTNTAQEHLITGDVTLSNTGDVQLVAGSVTNLELANDAVTTGKIADGQIQTTDIADANVTAPKLATNSVTTAKIGDGQVATIKIANDAVDRTKIAPDVAGAGLGQNANGSLEVNLGNGLTLSGDNIQADLTGLGGDGISDLGADGDLDVDINELAIITDPVADADLLMIYDASGSLVGKMTRQAFIESAAIGTINIDGGTIDGADIALGAGNTLNATAGTFTADNNVNLGTAAIQGTEIQDGSIATLDLASEAVTSDIIADNSIVNADVNSAAAIDGTKINPNFGAQAITTTGTLNADGVVNLADAAVATNILGTLSVAEQANFSGNVDASSGVDVTGDINVTGNVDGRDVGADGTNQDNLQALTGLAEGSSNLGTFTGAIITDNTTIKNALQELESNVGNITAENGLTETSPGTFQLGGLLTTPTTVTQGANAFTIENNGASNTTITLSNTGDFVVDGIAGDIIVDQDGVLSVGNGLTVIGTVNLDAGQIQSSEIQDATIVAADIANEAIGTTQIAANAVTTNEILDGTIANADLNKGNIPLSGFGVATANLPLGNNNITGLADPVDPQDAATKSYVESEVSGITLNNGSGITIDGTNNIDLGGNLDQATTITQGANAFTITNNGTANTTISLTSSGDFVIAGQTGDVMVDQSGLLSVGNGLNVTGTVNLDADQIQSSEIQDGTIVNSDVSPTAGIDASKIADGSVNNSEFQNLDGLNQSLATTDNVTFNQITGVLQTGAQPQITSVGTLTSINTFGTLNANGNTTLNGNINLGDASTDVITVTGGIVFDEATQDLSLDVADQTAAGGTLTIPDLAGGNETIALASEVTTDVVLRDGTNPLTSDWDAGSFNITAETFTSDVGTGTAPFTIASTTMVTNLNADQLDGQDAPAGAIVGTTDAQNLTNKTLTGATISGGTINGASIGATTPSTGVFTNLTADTDLTLNAQSVNEFSTDGTLFDNSNTAIPTEQAVKTYVDAQVGSQNLNEAYNDGNTITTAGGNSVVVAGTENLSVTATGGLDVTNNTTVGGTLGVTGATTVGDLTASGTVQLGNDQIQTNEIQDGQVTNAKLTSSTITVTDGTTSSDISLGNTLTFIGTPNEVEVSQAAGTITIGLPPTITANVTAGTADIDGGNIDGTAIGAATPSTGFFTALSSDGTGAVSLTANASSEFSVDGADLALETTTSGAIDIASAQEVAITAGEASSFTTTTGVITLNPATNVDIDGALDLSTQATTVDLINGTADAINFETGLLAVNTSTNVVSSTGKLDAATVDGGNLRLDANTLSSTDTNGNIVISPNGSGKVQVGTSGTGISSIIKQDVTLDVSSFTNSIVETVTVTGAQTGATVYVSPGAALPADTFIGYARVTSSDNVEILFVEVGSGSSDPASMTYHITVINP